MSGQGIGQTVSNTAQTAVGCLLLLAFLVASGYCQFVRTADEIGPAGVNTDGRQIWIEMIQSSAGSPPVTVTSEWEDSNLLVRLLVQEPMRTTLRFRTEESVTGVDTSARRSLDQNASAVTDGLGDRVPLRKDETESRADFVARLSKLGVRTVADLLGALGFRRYEVYSGGQLVFATDLPRIGQGNVKIAGTERK